MCRLRRRPRLNELVVDAGKKWHRRSCVYFRLDLKYQESSLLFAGSSGGFQESSSSWTALFMTLMSSSWRSEGPSLSERSLSEIGISGAALSWFFSYLTDRKYYITMHNYKSPTVILNQGVPQGSVLGPLLFIIYILPLGQIIRRHGFQYHCYADDIQIYTACRPDSIHQTTSLSSCINKLKTWLNCNFLSLNLTKTEILITGPPSLTKIFTNIPIPSTSILVNSVKLHFFNSAALPNSVPMTAKKTLNRWYMRLSHLASTTVMFFFPDYQHTLSHVCNIFKTLQQDC